VIYYAAVGHFGVNAYVFASVQFVYIFFSIHLFVVGNTCTRRTAMRLEFNTT
jgi:hypothetical protein